MSNCIKCSKPVYFNEQVEASGHLYHRGCFKCTLCKKPLTPGNHSQHKEDPYCNNCYSKEYGPKSYGKKKPTPPASEHQHELKHEHQTNE